MYPSFFLNFYSFFSSSTFFAFFFLIAIFFRCFLLLLSLSCSYSSFSLSNSSLELPSREWVHQHVHTNVHKYVKSKLFVPPALKTVSKRDPQYYFSAIHSALPSVILARNTNRAPARNWYLPPETFSLFFSVTFSSLLLYFMFLLLLLSPHVHARLYACVFACRLI